MTEVLDDRALFSPESMLLLSRAAEDLRYLLGRGYPLRSALTLIGDHLQLYKRQRQLLFRAVAAPEHAAHVRARTIPHAAIAGRPILVDGYNVLITLETAIDGGPI